MNMKVVFQTVGVETSFTCLKITPLTFPLNAAPVNVPKESVNTHAKGWIGTEGVGLLFRTR